MCPVLKTLPNGLPAQPGQMTYTPSAYEHTGCCGWRLRSLFCGLLRSGILHENGFKGRWKNNETAKSRVL